MCINVFGVASNFILLAFQRHGSSPLLVLPYHIQTIRHKTWIAKIFTLQIKKGRFMIVNLCINDMICILYVYIFATSNRIDAALFHTISI